MAMTASGRWCGWSGQVGRRVGVCVCVRMCGLAWSGLDWFGLCACMSICKSARMCVCMCCYGWACAVQACGRVWVRCSGHPAKWVCSW